MPGISRVIVDDIRIAPLTVDRVQVRRITIPAASATGIHLHNGPVFGVIESGVARVRIDGGETRELHAGDTFHEPAQTRIDRFDSAEDELVFLAWFPIGDGQEPTLIPLDD